jgi:3',5'-cyclic AMP phosphodiesterase CpdA
MIKGKRPISYGSARLHLQLLITAACLIVWVSQAFSESKAPKHFYFVQITDTHWGDRDHYERTRRIVDRINHLPFEIKCVVLTGDITMDRVQDETTVRRGLSLLKGLRMPVHFVPGNHDILRENYDLTQQAYKDHFGRLLTEREYEGVVFVLIYTEPLAKSFLVDGYKPLERLEAALKRAGRKPVVVFHHTPSVENFYRNQMHDGWRNKYREDWERLLNSYNVKAVIAGHFHRDEHHWLGEVPLYVCSPVAGYRGRQATFRIYEYKDGKVGYRTQYIP